MEKCSLCGGKIVNHRCVDCGMPYPEKPHYTLRSETAHTHNVNGEEVLHRVRSAAQSISLSPTEKIHSTIPEKERFAE